MEVALKVLAGSHAGQEIPVPAPKFLIGRAEDCHLRPKTDLISRHHCVLMVDEETVVIRDLGSRNGTYLNEAQLFGEHELRSGDTLKIGPLAFEVRISQPAARKRPKVNSIKEAAARTVEGPVQHQGDVTEWLTDSDTMDGSAETRELRAGETEEISLANTLIGKPIPEVANHQPVESAAKSDSVTRVDSPPQAPVPKPQPVTRTPAVAEAVDMPAQSEADAAAEAKAKARFFEIPTSNDAEKEAEKEKKKAAASPPKPATADSGQAAADVLRKFFKRR